jgi:hypothetical protein
MIAGSNSWNEERKIYVGNYNPMKSCARIAKEKRVETSGTLISFTARGSNF